MKKLFAAFALAFFVFVQFAHAVTVYYQPTPYPDYKTDGTPIDKNDISIVHVLEGWLPSFYYNQLLQRDGKLQIGGWGDWYRAYMKFDLTGLPGNVDSASLFLMPYSRGDASVPIPYAVCPVLGTWDSSLLWSPQPSYGSCWGWYPTPVAGTWTGFPLSAAGGPDWYNQWKNGTLANNGIMLATGTNNNNFDMFYSTAYNSYATDPYADSRRPVLQLIFTPTLQLKMPLPSGYSWLLTNEIGGYECKGGGGSTMWPDVAHADNGSSGNYYSIDVTWENNGTQYGQYNTPVLAAAGGVVYFAGGTDGNTAQDSNPNGFYIVIDHDYDQNPDTGFTTRYLHLKNPPHRKNGTLLHAGDIVNPGDEIGTMGSTGWYLDTTTGTYKRSSTGEHLHFGVRYQNHGYSYIPELTKVIMEDKLLKSYQTECAIDANGVPTSRIRYYGSTNVLTGY